VIVLTRFVDSRKIGLPGHTIIYLEELGGEQTPGDNGGVISPRYTSVIALLPDPPNPIPKVISLRVVESIDNIAKQIRNEKGGTSNG